MTGRFSWGLLAVVMAFGTAGYGTKEASAPTTVLGQPAGTERTGGKKNAGGEAVAEASASQSVKDDGKTYTIGIIVVFSDSHLHNTALNKQAQETKEKTNGRLTLKVMGSSQLGGERDYVEGMQPGSIEMAQVPSTVVSDSLNDSLLLSFPCSFKDYAKIKKVFDGSMGDELFAELEGIGIKSLT